MFCVRVSNLKVCSRIEKWLQPVNIHYWVEVIQHIERLFLETNITSVFIFKSSFYNVMILLKNLVIHISLFVYFKGRHISPSYLYFLVLSIKKECYHE